MNSLQLDLFVDVVDLPWHGRSPRSLTRSAKALFFRREPQKNERFFVDPGQLEFELPGYNAPWRYEGAPLLVGIS